MKLAFNNSGIIYIQRGVSIGKKMLEEKVSELECEVDELKDKLSER